MYKMSVIEHISLDSISNNWTLTIATSSTPPQAILSMVGSPMVGSSVNERSCTTMFSD